MLRRRPRREESETRTGGCSAVSTILDEILARTRSEVEQRMQELPTEELPPDDSSSLRGFRTALCGPGIAVIAEFKRRSPSAGQLRESPDVREMVTAYECGGAAALSILTDGPHFGGSLEDLRAARAASALPVLRKDFIVHPYQLHEARAAGADAVLLIVAALEPASLAELNAQARGLGLDVLVEVHDAHELGVALEVGADLVGINNRDLRDFSVDVQRTSRLLADVPPGTAVVSESGIATAEQLRDLQEQGVQAVLVGESLMRAPDPEQALRELCTLSGRPETF